MSKQPRPKTTPRPAADHGHDPAAGDTQYETTQQSTARSAKRSTRKPQQRPATEPDAEDRPTERVSLLLTPEDAKELKRARIEDGIDANKRIRAMISLWRSSEAHRKRVDTRAKQYRR